MDRRLTRVFLLAFVAVIVVAGGRAQAADVTVTCPPFSGGDYNSINAALGALDLVGPHNIYVKGTCQERVFIGDGIVGRRNVSILADAVEAAIVEPPPAGQGRGAAIVICGAQDIYLERLVIRNAAIGLQVCDLTEVDTSGLTIENNSSVGADVYGNSMVFFSDQAVIRNNGQVGVQARGGSRVFFLHSRFAPTGTVVEGHRQWGVYASRGSSVELLGVNEVRGNGTAGNADSGGIKVIGTGQLLVTSSTQGNPSISNNAGTGALLRTGSSLTLQGATVSGNGGSGVALELLSVADVLDGNTFSSNAALAVSCDESSWAGGLTAVAPTNCAKIKK